MDWRQIDKARLEFKGRNDRHAKEIRLNPIDMRQLVNENMAHFFPAIELKPYAVGLIGRVGIGSLSECEFFEDATVPEGSIQIT